MSRQFVRDRLNVELRDYTQGFHWVEEFASILRNCDLLELRIHRLNGASGQNVCAEGSWRADLRVMAISSPNLANGIAALSVFRKEDPNIPIVALTDEQGAKPLLRLMEAG